MRPKNLNLSTRAFLLAFFPMCLALAASFLAVEAAIKEKTKGNLKETLRHTDKLLDRITTDMEQRNMQLLAILAENSGLKAGIGLLLEVSPGSSSRLLIQRTVEAQLLEMSQGLDYDFLAVADSKGRPVAVLVGREPHSTTVDWVPVTPGPSALFGVDGDLYEGNTLPINLGAENVGSLTVGKKFDIRSLNSVGEAVMVGLGKVVLTTFPPEKIGEMEQQLQKRCARVEEECEVNVGGETYLVLPFQTHRTNLLGGYQFLSLQSIDAALQQSTAGFKQVFLMILLGGLVVVLSLSAVLSRSLSRPITNLITRLTESERTGQLQSDFPTDSRVTEVDRLGSALNRAAAVISEARKHLEQCTLEFIESMARALDARDTYTAGHSDRVSANSVAIARTMDLPPKQIEIIRIGGKLHDIGKIGVPDAVLQKPGRLTKEEYDLIKLHPQIGKKILEKVGRFQDYLPIVEWHHENHDGSGYPHGLKGEEIPLDVRIVHVADVYDAISSDRAYRTAMSEQHVLQILTEGSGKQFDPQVVEVFLSILQGRRVLDEILEEADLVRV